MSSTPESNGRLRILYVDDDPTAAVSLERILARLGHHVTGFRSANDAVACCASRPHDWDLLVTDFRMPDLDGVDVAHAVRSHRPDLPMILITGYATAPDLVRARQVGFGAILAKPATLSEIADAIRRAVSPPFSDSP